MSIWHKEVIRVNGNLKAYIEVQNDYTGTIQGGLREIHVTGDAYWVRADGHLVDVTAERQRFISHESDVESALKLWRSNSWMH